MRVFFYKSLYYVWIVFLYIIVYYLDTSGKKHYPCDGGCDRKIAIGIISEDIIKTKSSLYAGAKIKTIMIADSMDRDCWLPI